MDGIVVGRHRRRRRMDFTSFSDFCVLSNVCAVGDGILSASYAITVHSGGKTEAHIVNLLIMQDIRLFVRSKLRFVYIR